MIFTTSSVLSPIWNNSSSPSETRPRSTSTSSIHFASPSQYSLPVRIIGNRWIFPVCINVTVSKTSSSVPHPPENSTNTVAHFTSITFRTKK